MYKTFTLEYGSEITSESIPEKEGYTFSGWDKLPETMPAKDVTVTGAFTINSYTLTYILEGKVYKTFTLEYGSEITSESIPEKEGYTFSGWDKLPETMPAKDVTVTGAFTINQYSVTFIIDGEVFETMTLNYGSEIVPPNVPEKDNYDFSWGEFPKTMPAKDVTVYGSYTTGIDSITREREVEEYYFINGKRIPKLQHGINIIRMKNGTVKKVMVK